MLKYLTYQWGFVKMINDSKLSIFSDNIYFFKPMDTGYGYLYLGVMEELDLDI